MRRKTDEDIILKMLDKGTRWVAHDQPCGQVYHLGPVFFHFLWYVFNIPSRATSTGRVTDNLNMLMSLILTECTIPVFNGSKALTTATLMVAIADDDTNFYVFFHNI